MPNYSHGTKVTLATAEEPPYLSVGTDVSAKYKGAFCEAKITEVSKHVKLRVLFDGCTGSYLIDDSDLKAGSTLETGTKIEAKHPEKKQQTFIPATITKILDHSRYTVVFDDGDQCVLRRNSICLKSGKHFAESETLDQLPLTNPEHFGNPVKVGSFEQNHHQNNHNNHQHQTATSKAASGNNNNSNSTNNNNHNNSGQTNSAENGSCNNVSRTQQNHVKQETTNDKPRGKASGSNSAANGTTPTATGARGRGAGKGRKRRESTSHSSKQDSIDELGDSSQDSADVDVGPSNIKYELIEIGTRLMVQYGKGKVQNVYEAKVNKIETNSAGRVRYFVHYLGWNNRYDEWITRNRIVNIVTDKENGGRDGRSRHHHHHTQPIEVNITCATVNSTTTPPTATTATTTINTTNNITSNSTPGATAAKEQAIIPELVKEKDVPHTKTRRSRQTENSQSSNITTSATTASNTTTTSTVTTTTSTNNANTTASPTAYVALVSTQEPAKEKEVPQTKTRRSRQTENSQASVATTISNNNSDVKPVITCTTVTSANSTITNVVAATATTTTELTQNSTSGISSAKEQSSIQESTKEKEVPQTKTRRSRQTDNSHTPCTTSASTLSTNTTSTINTTVTATASSSSNTTTTTIATNCNSVSSVPLVKEQKTGLESVKEEGVPKTKTRRSRQVEIAQITPVTTSPQLTVPNTVTTSTTAAPPRDCSDREIETQSTKTRGSSRQTDNGANSNTAQSSNISSAASTTSTTSRSSVTSTKSSAATITSTAIANIGSPLDNVTLEPDCDKRISILQEKIMTIRQTYLALKTELADLDRRRKRPRLERSNSDHINFDSVTCRN